MAEAFYADTARIPSSPHPIPLRPVSRMIIFDD